LQLKIVELKIEKEKSRVYFQTVPFNKKGHLDQIAKAPSLRFYPNAILEIFLLTWFAKKICPSISKKAGAFHTGQDIVIFNNKCCFSLISFITTLQVGQTSRSFFANFI